MSENTFLKIVDYDGEDVVINCKYIIDLYHGYTPHINPRNTKKCVVIKMQNDSTYYTYGNFFQIANDIERILGKYKQQEMYRKQHEKASE